MCFNAMVTAARKSGQTQPNGMMIIVSSESCLFLLQTKVENLFRETLSIEFQVNGRESTAYH